MGSYYIGMGLITEASENIFSNIVGSISGARKKSKRPGGLGESNTEKFNLLPPEENAGTNSLIFLFET